jgi:hypothetical protein
MLALVPKRAANDLAFSARTLGEEEALRCARPYVTRRSWFVGGGRAWKGPAPSWGLDDSSLIRSIIRAFFFSPCVFRRDGLMFLLDWTATS